MFNWIKSLFGKGMIYANGKTTCGKTFTARAEYIGDPETFDLALFVRRIELESNRTVESISVEFA